MYREHFYLKELPFSIAPNPRYLYLTHQHQEALAHLVYGLNSAGGVILLTGEVGTGKTTISRKLLENIPDNIDIAWIVNPRLSVEELLAAICDELRISYPKDNHSIKIFTDLISKRLIQAHARNHNVVLIIDEAQNLSPEVLEQLRLLTNLETSERKLLQIVLLGQPELKTMLERSDLRQLAQRITARYHLHELSQAETIQYIRHRLAVGGCSRPVFSPRAAKLIHRISHGTPRLINLLCDRAMLGVYSAGGSMVHPKHVRQASAEVLGKSDAAKRPLLLPITACLLLIAAGAGFATGSWQPFIDKFSLLPALQTTTPSVRATGAEFAPIPAPTIAVTDQMAETLPAEPHRYTADAQPVSTAREPALKHTALHLEEEIKIHPNIEAANKTTQPLSASLWDTINTSGTKILAMQTLARLWHVELDTETDPCLQLELKHLSCLSQPADIWRLQQLERPAIFDIEGSDAYAGHAVIRSIANGRAIIELGEQQWIVKLSALKQQWQKQLTLIWNKPPGYTGKLQQGDSGMAVEWLARQLDRIQGTMIPPRQVHNMDNILVERLKDFQRSEKIKPDGIAGALTLMRINERIGLNIPRLVHGATN